MQTILITGVNGFIAGHLLLKLCDLYPGASVIGVGRQLCPQELLNISNFEYVIADLRNTNFQTILPAKVDTIIHFAGDRRTFVPPSEYTSQINSNVLVTSQMVDYAIQAKASQFIYASSVYVYSGCETIPFREDFVNEYPKENLGASKLSGERILKSRSEAGHFTSTSFRIFTAYGPRMGSSQFLPIAVNKLLTTDSEAIFFNPEVTRDFIYVDDIVDAVIISLQRIQGRENVKQSEVFNLGSGTATSIREVINLLVNILNVSKPIRYDVNTKPSHQGDNDHQADLTKIKTCLGWSPRMPLEKGLRELIRSLAQ